MISKFIIKVMGIKQGLTDLRSDLYKVKRVKLKLSFCGLIAREVKLKAKIVFSFHVKFYF